MLTLIFAIMMIGVFVRLIGFAIRLSWGFFKILLALIFLPGIIIAVYASGLLYLALPILAIVGLVSLVISPNGGGRRYRGPDRLDSGGYR